MFYNQKCFHTQLQNYSSLNEGKFLKLKLKSITDQINDMTKKNKLSLASRMEKITTEQLLRNQHIKNKSNLVPS